MGTGILTVSVPVLEGLGEVMPTNVIQNLTMLQPKRHCIRAALTALIRGAYPGSAAYSHRQQ